MPVKLRLKRQGRKKAVHFAIVASDARARRDGRYIEKIGTYNPVKEPARLYVDHEAALRWLQNGAQPTLTVRHLLRHAGVTVKFALMKQGKTEDQAEEIYGRWLKEKQAAKKKKMVMVDREGNLLEEVPEVKKPVAKKEEAPAPAAEEAPAAEAEAAVEEVPAAEVEAPAAEEEAPAAEAETPAAEAEAPAAEEEAPAAEEEAPAAEEEKKEE